jgi:hypothetical protein
MSEYRTNIIFTFCIVGQYCRKKMLIYLSFFLSQMFCEAKNFALWNEKNLRDREHSIHKKMQLMMSC